jgi:multiple sugar transport system substrate-binding protein
MSVKKSSLRSLAGLALAATLLLGTACIKHADDKGVVKILSFGDLDMMNKTRELLKRLEEREGIKTEILFVPYANLKEKLLTQLAAGVAPDVVWVEVGLFVPLVHANAFVPLDEFLSKDRQELKAQYPQVVQRFTSDGKLYAIPQDTAPIACVYYNKAMFRAAGLAFPKNNWKWADLLADAKKLTQREKDGHVKVFGFQDDGGPNWQGIIYSNGGRLVDDWTKPTHCVLDEPQAVEAVQFLADLINIHKVTPSDAERDTLATTAQDAFMAGHVAMFRSGIWVTPTLRKAKNLDWDIAPFPMGPRAKHPGWNTGGSGWAVTHDARDKVKAWKVARFLASEESQKFNMTSGFAQPSIMSLAKSPEFTKNAPPANKGFMVDAPKYAMYTPDHEQWDEAMQSYADPELNNVFRGTAPVEATLKKIAAKVNKKLFSKKP